MESPLCVHVRGAAVALAMLGGVSALVGCRPLRPEAAILPMIALATPGTEIRAEDGSWTFPAGPAVSIGPNANKHGAPCSTDHTLEAGDFADWQHGGAVHVLVTTPDTPEPLHGIYAICPVTSAAFPITAYEIEIPKERVTAAQAGGISVIYQVSTTQPNTYAWALWLSREPFPK